MPAAQNLTVRLDKSVVRKARVLAAQRGVSISRLVADTIERLTQEEEAYERAMRGALDDLDDGLSLDGPPYLTRDEAHAR